MPSESAGRTIGVTLGVSLVCSLLVSATAVSLQERQRENSAGATVRTVMADLDLLAEGERVGEAFDRTAAVLVDLDTGEILTEEKYDEVLNPEDFDVEYLASHPEYGRAVPDGKDDARIGRMPRYMRIWVVRERGGEAVEKYAFPIYGRGLYSTIRGVLALSPDLKTVDSVSFYEHGETPGLGGEIENPSWKRSWRGKEALDDGGNVLIRVLDGPVDPGSAKAHQQIDGLSGATYTSRGLDRLVRFWLGEEGYGPTIARLRKGGE